MELSAQASAKWRNFELCVSRLARATLWCRSFYPETCPDVARTQLCKIAAKLQTQSPQERLNIVSDRTETWILPNEDEHTGYNDCCNRQKIEQVGRGDYTVYNRILGRKWRKLAVD